ncbi:MAG: hybrid sensor histidine kinase/response regulator [Thalassobaculales bacterium]
MDDLLSEFLTETAENLSTLDVELVKLEQNPNDPELLSNIFRLVHTIKGTCGFLGLPRLEAVAHASENVLGKFRDGAMTVTPPAVTLILASLDRIKHILSVLERTEAEPPGDDAELIAQLDAAAAGELQPAAAPPPAAAEPPAPPPADEAESDDPEMRTEQDMEHDPDYDPGLGRRLKPGEVPLDELEAIFNATPGPGQMQTPPALAPDSEPAPARASANLPDSTPAMAVEAKEPSVASQSIRVSVDLLENLMTTVSELVLTRNQLLQIARRHKDSEFTVPLQRLSQVTSELQEGVMKTRMQPIGNAWAKLPRLVRDLSHELHKKIDLVMLGADTELDRQVLELIKDPLTHMVRNSADHGIEVPEVRVKAGKPETGRITLNAYHEGGHIIIEVSDDGKGLDIERIKAKAIQNGLATESELAGMAEQQILQFIFKAGFSTAAAVTSVSGRGVGMDVVRTNIEKIGGTIELKNRQGKGSSFIIKIPLTLAIVSALIVEACGERFAIPQISVVELVRATASGENPIETINGAPVLRLRNRLLPLVSLERLLQLDMPEGQEPAKDAGSFVVVTQVGAYSFGIMVDRVFDTEEIVVKPVAPILRNITMFSGNTILGDGSVIMILDPNGIAGGTGEMGVTDSRVGDQVTSRESGSDNRTSLLVFRAGGSAPKAVPLALVARLEDIAVETIEFSDGQPMVQYRGKLMPLVPIEPGYTVKSEGKQPVLVFSDDDHTMGLMVDEIVDIVEDRVNVELRTSKPGVMGSAIITGKATDVIDAGYYLTQAFSDWFERSAGELPAAGKRRKRVLVVDDSPFFRNLLTPLLSVGGFEVTTAAGGEEALQMHENGLDIDAVVSDIEMPGMDGFQLCEALRAGGRWQDLPIIALTARTGPRDVARAREVGFTDYVAKFDRDALVQSLAQSLAQPAAA